MKRGDRSQRKLPFRAFWQNNKLGRSNEESKVHEDADHGDPGRIRLWVPVKDVCCKYEISDATYYNWKSKCAGVEACDLKRMNELGHCKKLYPKNQHNLVWERKQCEKNVRRSG